MISKFETVPIRTKFFTKGTSILAVMAGLGILGYVYRLFFGLEAATNLSNAYPWGIWKTINVVAGVALAAAGFTTAAVADIFHRERYHVLVRPAILTAMLGYTFAVIGLIADLGRYYNIWHPIIPSMWQGDSVLFEVGMCVMMYLCVLYIEFLPTIVEHYRDGVRLPGLLSCLNSLVESLLEVCERYLIRFISLFIIAGVVLSCLHQSSLGALMLVAPTKMHPIWNTPMSPVLFLFSAIAVGFPILIFELILISRTFHRPPPIPLLSNVARYVPVLLGVYLAVRIGDLTLREVWPNVMEGTFASFAFIFEIVVGVILPIILLSRDRLRQSASWLLVGSVLVILGVIVNRVNVFLVAYRPLYAVSPYFPSIIEITVTVGLISIMILIYRFFIVRLPVLPRASQLQSASSEEPKPLATQLKGE
ncbi:MAG: Ni/Fe-hydrogenase cytochrome b subunit [Candidatus Zixiibacteriota bacterium]|nr:MAG: Ni/Fe-hydrogenase cytochrome b subunit [candidate division Zixibacteria bacterium]